MNRRVYRYFISITSQFYFCGVPFRLDSYKTCSFNCLYCYARTRGGNFGFQKQSFADPCKLEKLVRAALIYKKTSNAILECLFRKVPLHWGGMSDPFQPCENKHKISLMILQILKEYNYPIIISTKSDLLIKEPYLSILKKYPNLIVQISLSTSNDSLRKKLEPNVPSVNKRLNIIKTLSLNGIRTYCRIQPLILRVNSNDIKLIKLLRISGCKKVIIEHYKVPIDSQEINERKINSIVGYDLKFEYKKLGAKLIGREYVLPAKTKLENLSNIVNYMKSCKMQYCFADNDLQYLGDSECCCGIDNINGFENWFRHNIALAVHRGYRKGNIEYSLISKEWAPRGSIRMFLNSKCRINTNRLYKLKSMKDFIKHKWNTPNSVNSPTEFYNVAVNKKQRHGYFEYDFKKGGCYG